MLATNTMVLHLRFNGRSEELDLHTLDLHSDVTDAELRTALAKRYDVALTDLNDYVIVREPQAIIVRPVAIYG